jgi:glycosyltransferase involved in cell wall biosynthesis
MLSQTPIAFVEQMTPIPLSRQPERPLVSILMGTYNYEQYLPIAIESVCSQSYEHWELIVVDDGSTDHSWNILESYSRMDRRISVTRQTNGGHGGALNTAYALAGGDIIALLDADDAFLPEKLERIVKQFHADPESGILIHRLQRIDAAGRQYGDAMPDTLVHGFMGPKALQQGGNVSGVPPTSGLAFRRDVAREIFPIPAVFRRAADAYLFRLAQFLTPVTCLQEFLSLYRVHGANVTAGGINSQTIGKLVEDYHRIYAAQLDFLNSHFGPVASRQLDIRAAPGYCEFVLCTSLLSGRFPANTPFQDQQEARRSLRRFSRRAMWGLLGILPRSIAASLLTLFLHIWWSESRLGTAFRNTTRRLGF